MQGACSSLPLALPWRRVLHAARTRHEAPGRWRSAFATEAATKLRLVEQACGCSTVRGGGGLMQGACSSLPLALPWRRVLHAARTRHEAPSRWRSAFATEAATKLRLIEQACGCSTVRGGSCKVVFQWRRVLHAARTRHEAPSRWRFAFATEAATKLRLIEQACGCSTVRSRV